jgi:hypothetical protein
VEYLEAREVLSAPDWFSRYLPDDAVASLARSDYADHGAINFRDMLAIYNQIAVDGVVDDGEYVSLQSLTQNASVLHVPDYVNFLSTQVIDPTDPANSSFRGTSLPELGPGSPAWTLQLLVGKWFLGADHPMVDEDGLTYSTVGGTLFGSGGPSFLDVAQGDAIDCWLMSSLATTEARDSGVIQNMFIYDGTSNGIDIWTVRFFEDGSPVYVTVDNQLPMKNGSIVYARPQGGVLWVALAEKAYAQLNEFAPNITPSPGENSYAALDQQANGYQAMKTLSTVTGQDTTAEGPGTTWTLIQSGRPAVLLASEPSSPYLRDHHFYAAIDFDASTGHFTVYDPYGIQQSQADGKWGLLWANEAFLHQNYYYVVGCFGGGNKATKYDAIPYYGGGDPGAVAKVGQSQPGADGHLLISLSSPIPALRSGVLSSATDLSPTLAAGTSSHRVGADGPGDDFFAALAARQKDGTDLLKPGFEHWRADADTGWDQLIL